jgi:hypothetical protein
MAGVQLFTERVLVAKIVGLIALVLAALVMRRLGGTAAGLLMLLDPVLHFAALSGMEISLFLLLCLLAMERCFAGKPAQAGLAAAGALLARPEGAIIWAILLLLHLVWRARFGTCLKKCALLALPTLLAAGVWIVYCLLVTGRPFPNTFYAKLGPLFGCNPQDPFTFFHAFCAQEGLLFLPLFCLLALAALLRRPARRASAGLIFTLLFFLGVYATRPLLRMDVFYWQRYLIPALAGMYLVMGTGLQTLWAKGRGWKGAAMVLGTLLAVTLSIQCQEKRERYAMNCRDIERFNVAAGRWIRDHTAPDIRVAVGDAGALRYFGDREVIDLAGLNTHWLANPTSLADQLDIYDLAALAAYAEADWLVIPARHYLDGEAFTLFHKITYEDYSLYVHPERFSLLFLKKEHTIK